MREMNVADIIRLNARTRAEREALVVGDLHITYGRYQEDIERTAAALAAAGVDKGDRVAALGRNSYEYTQLYFALARLGAILVPLSFWHRTPELAYAVQDAEPMLIFVEPELWEPLAPALEELEFPLDVVKLPGQDGERGEWDAFIEAARGADAPMPEIAPEDPHMILYTSGTTGRPKGAILSHGRTVRDGIAMAMHLGLKQDDTFMDYFPSFHVGNWDHLKLYMLVGARVVLLREFDTEAVYDAIAEHRPTVILGVPTMFHSLLGHPRRAEADLSCVRLVYYGAYDPSGLMYEVAEAFGVTEGRAEMCHTYGLTEGGPFVAFCPHEDLFDHWGSIGRAMVGVELALLDDDLNEVPAGAAGEICIRGPHMSGYWRKPEETEAAFAGGWMHTGDMAIADDQGFLMIVDRKKDMIRSGGQNVYSKEVEDCLALHPKVDDVAVVGLPDAVYEELVCAVVVPMPGEDPGDELAAELIAHVKANLAGYNAPKRVEFVTELPTNAVGKTQKHLLREKFGSMFDVERTAPAA
ncbi:MAG TPA: AMP-binding protein [Solirubrobacterales bacterium]|nr:AMP-binding protein [Solirubrobacterales bacterium]